MNLIGERLFPLVAQITADHALASKVTGMLLELRVVELLRMLESPEALQVRVREATRVLQSHQLKRAGPASASSAAAPATAHTPVVAAPPQQSSQAASSIVPPSLHTLASVDEVRVCVCW